MNILLLLKGGYQIMLIKVTDAYRTVEIIEVDYFDTVEIHRVAWNKHRIFDIICVELLFPIQKIELLAEIVRQMILKSENVDIDIVTLNGAVDRFYRNRIPNPMWTYKDWKKKLIKLFKFAGIKNSSDVIVAVLDYFHQRELNRSEQ
jgi:hypothetical protein